MKAAAAVLAASLIFFLGVLTGVGRREAVPPPDVITLGAVNGPAASDAPEQPSPDAPKGTATTTTSTAPATPPSTGGPTGSETTGATATTVTTATTGTATTGTPAATRPPNTTTTRPGDVEEVDGQVNCRPQGKGNGKREPCPSTTTSTGETPGGNRNQR